jgi:hypothetical protein
MDSRKNQPPRRRVYREQPRRDNYDNHDYDDYEPDYEEPRRRSLPARTRARRKRRTWPMLLTGCALGVLVTVLGAAAVIVLAIRNTQGDAFPNIPVLSPNSPFTKEEPYPLPLTGALTQLQVCDKFGNVSIRVDPDATKPSITAKKNVQATDKAAADKAFQSLVVQVAPLQNTTTKLTCTQSTPAPTTQTSPSSSWLVNVTFPGDSTLVRENTNSVDLTILLPPTSMKSDGLTLPLVDVEATVGNIAIDGLIGVLNISGGAGNVSVSHAALADNSQIDTSQGNVTFNGILISPNSPNTTAHYFIRSEQGTLDVTLPSTTNAMLDAYTNVGTIKCAFPVTVTPEDNGTASAQGPLTTSTPSTNAPVLVVHVSTGNINIHQQQ